MAGDFETFDAEAQATFRTSLVAGLDGIEDSQVNIVDVREGSIIVTTDITPLDGQTLDDIKAVQAAAFSGGIGLGYPVINAAHVSLEDS